MKELCGKNGARRWAAKHRVNGHRLADLARHSFTPTKEQYLMIYWYEEQLVYRVLEHIMLKRSHECRLRSWDEN